MYQFSTILFDLDDTLFESSRSIKEILRSLLKKCNYAASEEDLNKYLKINSHYWKLLQRGEIDFTTLKTERFKVYLDTINITIHTESFSAEFLEMFKDAIELVDGAYDLCQKLYMKGCKLYIASNGEDLIQKERIVKAGLAPFFSGYFNSDVVGYLKPSVEFYNYIIDNIDEKDPRKILMVGDSYSTDIESAAMAGIYGCWFYRKEMVYTQKSPCITIKSLRELGNILLP